MRYFDTCFLIPLFFPEATSHKINGFVGGLADGTMALGHLTRVEFSAFLAREVRMRTLAPSDALLLDRKFEDFVGRSFTVLTPGPADFDLAKRFLQDFETGLRTGDALHLALAANHRAEAIHSLDKSLIRAGRRLGLPVEPGIALEGYDAP